MNDLTLEKEFERVKTTHMISICMSVLMYDLECQAEKTVNIPFFLIREQAEKHAMETIGSIVKAHKFDEFYEVCWDRLMEIAPNAIK